MANQHIVFLTNEEIKALSNLCQTALNMKDIPYFQAIEAEAKSALAKLEEASDGK